MDNHAGAAVYFFVPFVIALIGAFIHVKRIDASGPRAVELFLVWWLVVSGVVGVLGAIGHLGPTSTEVAEGIGYEQSMFQWEVGWADMAVAVLLLACAWRRDSGWLIAAVTAWTILYVGDAIGHLMEWVAHDNTAPSNVWALPADVIGPVVAIVLLLSFLRSQRDPARSTTPVGATVPRA